MSTNDPGKLFDAYYYATGLGNPYEANELWRGFFGSVAEQIISQIGPQRVMDAGCAMGILVEALRLRGVAADGIDISEYAISNAPALAQPFVRVGSVAEPFGERYDLIICIEVLEHMERAAAERAVANFCAHSDDILFSSSPMDYKEATHFNVQPIEYWAELFARHGFYRDVDFDANFITSWAVRFRKRSEPAARVVRDYERRYWMLWKENSDLRALAGEQRATTHALAAQNEQLNAQLAHLRSELAQTQQALAAQQAAISQFEQRHTYLAADLGRKDRHIAWLEGLVRGFERGRFQRLMRLLKRQKPILPPNTSSHH